MIGASPVTHSVEEIEAAAAVVRARFGSRPDLAIMLSDGHEALLAEIAIEASIDYSRIPGFPASDGATRDGQLLCGTLGRKIVVVMRGRAHHSDGSSLQHVTFPVRVLRALGARSLLLTSVGQSVNPLWENGDLMLIADHINFLGDNPLIGRHDGRLGARFPDMSAPYDEHLRALARDVASEERMLLREGIFAEVSDAGLATRAEQRMLRAIGADVLGVGAVPEVIVATHAQMRVLALSTIGARTPSSSFEWGEKATIRLPPSDADSRLGTLLRRVVERS